MLYYKGTWPVHNWLYTLDLDHSIIMPDGHEIMLNAAFICSRDS